MDFTILDNLKKSLKFNIYSLLDEVFKTNQVQSTMIEFNQDQLKAGYDSTGQFINTSGGSPYRLYTVKIKQTKGQPVNKVTLYDTGEFYKTFKVKIVKDGYLITANFEKEDGSILDNFSNNFDFMGLDNEGIQELTEQFILPILTKLLRKKLGL